MTAEYGVIDLWVDKNLTGENPNKLKILFTGKSLKLFIFLPLPQNLLFTVGPK